MKLSNFTRKAAAVHDFYGSKCCLFLESLTFSAQSSITTERRLSCWWASVAESRIATNSVVSKEEAGQQTVASFNGRANDGWSRCIMVEGDMRGTRPLAKLEFAEILDVDPAIILPIASLTTTTVTPSLVVTRYATSICAFTQDSGGGFQDILSSSHLPVVSIAVHHRRAPVEAKSRSPSSDPPYLSALLKFLLVFSGVKYVAKLEDGTVVLKSDGVEFTVEEGYFCPALAKAVKTMKKGERVILTVKPEYAFGENGRPASGDEGAVPWNASLQIDLELYERPNDGAVVQVKLIGKLQDGTVFVKKGHDDEQPFEFKIDEE
ncbi:Peptidyl-prolyl cis-trans isomerase [Arachis hypogaea]|nr:Peptidyl-prolyl cis-trans isomerase [Arachis hypogaea]